MIYYMGNLPRLELTEEKSNLKNNDYIIFRNVSKGKTGRVKRIKTRRMKRVKTGRVKRKTKKFFDLF